MPSDLDAQLLVAVRSGNVEKVASLIDAGADVTVRDGNDDSTLLVTLCMSATEFTNNITNISERTKIISSQYAPILKLLLDTQKIDVNDNENRDGVSALNMAAWYKHPSLLSLLLGEKNIGKSILTFDGENASPLHRAVTNLAAAYGACADDGSLDLQESLKLMLSSRAGGRNVDAKWWQKGGDYDDDENDEEDQQVETTIENESQDVSSVVGEGKGHFCYSDEEGEDEAFGRRHTPLCAAAEAGNVEGMKLLIAAGADLYVKDYNGMTVLHHAAKRGSVEGVKFLLEQQYFVVTSESDDDEDERVQRNLNAASTDYSGGTPLKLAKTQYDGLSKNVEDRIAQNGGNPLTAAGDVWVVKLSENFKKVMELLEAAGGTL